MFGIRHRSLFRMHKGEELGKWPGHEGESELFLFKVKLRSFVRGYDELRESFGDYKVGPTLMPYHQRTPSPSPDKTNIADFSFNPTKEPLSSRTHVAVLGIPWGRKSALQGVVVWISCSLTSCIVFLRMVV